MLVEPPADAIVPQDPTKKKKQRTLPDWRPFYLAKNHAGTWVTIRTLIKRTARACAQTVRTGKTPRSWVRILAAGGPLSMGVIYSPGFPLAYESEGPPVAASLLVALCRTGFLGLGGCALSSKPPAQVPACSFAPLVAGVHCLVEPPCEV